MRFALLQYPIVWADKETNLRLLHDRLAGLQGKTDVVVVPEMFSTGFCTDHPELAEPWGGPTCRKLQEWADLYRLAIVGSMMCEEGARLVNRGFMFRRRVAALPRQAPPLPP